MAWTTMLLLGVIAWFAANVAGRAVGAWERVRLAETELAREELAAGRRELAPSPLPELADHPALGAAATRPAPEYARDERDPSPEVLADPDRSTAVAEAVSDAGRELFMRVPLTVSDAADELDRHERRRRWRPGAGTGAR